MSDWINRNLVVWERKAGLRHFYRKEIFGRILGMQNKGRTLELGAGPGFFCR